MNQSLRRDDYITLHHIIQESHKKYLKQSRINKQPAFNILRVLTSFKQTFPTTPQRLYKLIVLITKKFNPQTLTQWKKAIQQINSISIKNTNQHSINLALKDSGRQDQSITQKRKNQENSIKTYKQQLDHQIDYIDSKRSRLKFMGDYRITEPSWVGTQHNNQEKFYDHQIDENKQNNMQFSNKNSSQTSQYAHYISFEPGQAEFSKEKAQKIRHYTQDFNFNHKQLYQNSNKINPYHQISKIDNLSLIYDRQPTSKDESKTLYSNNNQTEDNSRIYNHPSRTPRDQSIIRNNGMVSKDSSVSIIKSQMIQTSKIKEISEYQDFNMTLQQWEGLNEKTNIFYQFNTKLKGFIALLANYQAFQSDRSLKNRARIFHQSYLSSKVLIALKQNIQVQLIYKQKLQKAKQMHENVLCKKSWKVFNLLRNLKISKPKRKIQTQKLNKTSFEFLISFMFEQKQIGQSSSRKENEQSLKKCFDLEKKAEYFSNSQNFENVWNIYKCFGLNIQINREQMEIFFKKYHQCLLRTIFRILKKNIEEKKHKYVKMHNTRLTQKSFQILISRYKVIQEEKKRILTAESWSSNKLKQKVYKILLSIVYTTKIFSKRQAFIKAQKINKTKKNILKKWITECKSLKIQKKKKQTKLIQFCHKIKKFILKISFIAVKQDSIEVEQKMNRCLVYWQERTLKRIFKHFTVLLKGKQKYLSLCQNNEVEFKRKIMKRWSNYTKVKQSLHLMDNVLKKIVFRSMFIPAYKNLFKRYLLNQQEEGNIVKNFFYQMRTYTQDKISQRKSLISRVQILLLSSYSVDFINQLQINKSKMDDARKVEKIGVNYQKLEKYLKLSSNKMFFTNLRHTFQQESLANENIRRVNELIKKNALLLINKNVHQVLEVESNSQLLVNCKKKGSFSDFCQQIKRSSLDRKYHQLKRKKHRKTYQLIMSKINATFLKSIEQNQSCINHYNESIKQKVLLSLVKEFININQKGHRLDLILNDARKRQFLLIFQNKSNKQIQIRTKSEIVNKRQAFSQIKLNSSLQKKIRRLSNQLKGHQAELFFDNLEIRRQMSKRTRLTAQMSGKLKIKLFFMRFNDNFVTELFKKKHIFMAFKFRALKLYQSAFLTWKSLRIIKHKQHGLTNKSLQKVSMHQRLQKGERDVKKTKSVQKQYSHICRPTYIS